MSLIFEVVKRVKLGEEHRWTASIEGHQVFPWKKQNKKKEFGREASKRKRSTAREFTVDTFCWPTCKRPRSNPNPCTFFVIDSDEEDCEVVEDSCVPGSPGEFGRRLGSVVLVLFLLPVWPEVGFL